MSWHSYVERLEAVGCTKAAVVGQNGSIWAKSNSLELSPADLNTICSTFSNPTAIFEHGLRLVGVKYLGIAASDEEVYGKKGQCGLVLCKTKKAIVLAFHPEGCQPGTCRNEVGKVADHLKEYGS